MSVDHLASPARGRIQRFQDQGSRPWVVPGSPATRCSDLLIAGAVPIDRRAEGRHRRAPRRAHDRRSDRDRLLGAHAEGTPAQVSRLDQLFARSQREIEAHAVEIATTETGRYYIDEAARLLAGLRMWAQA